MENTGTTILSLNPVNYLLFSIKLHVFVDDRLIKTESLKKGFSISIPSKEYMKVTIKYLYFFENTYEIDGLDSNLNYEVKFQYDKASGKLSDKIQIQ